MQDEINRWQYLSEEAKAGRLYVDADVAKQCRAALDRQIELYGDVRNNLAELSRVSGLGDFAEGLALARLLGLKAVDPAGDGDLDTALKDHIQVLGLIGETIQVSLDRLLEQDSSNAQDLDKV
ncbi:hypothetical protein [Nocardia arizonensis]|uniref:hypothetical protein n=1 Tax=Nocardia arizonensis TaxID=1141647 RepID=UPI0006D230AA|nr:hypothetical protein [Nocardia arizonensis]